MRIFRRLDHCSAFSEAASQVYSMAFSLSTSKRHFFGSSKCRKTPIIGVGVEGHRVCTSIAPVSN
jgi:hypothetical protein